MVLLCGQRHAVTVTSEAGSSLGVCCCAAAAHRKGGVLRPHRAVAVRGDRAQLPGDRRQVLEQLTPTLTGAWCSSLRAFVARCVYVS